MSDIDIAMLQSIRSDLQQAKIVSQNIANVNTVGYKSIQTTGLNFQALVDGPRNQNTFKMSLINRKFEPTPGQVKITGRELDLAVEGEAFMLVALNNTEYLVTSQSFFIDNDNMLVTGDGSRLQGAAGDIKISSSSIVIKNNGDIMDGKNLVDTIRIVKSSTDFDLNIAETGFLNAQNTEAANSNEFSLKQGQLTMSNVDSSRQMIKLMELTKHIESTQRAFSTIDQIFDTGINQIGNR